MDEYYDITDGCIVWVERDENDFDHVFFDVGTWLLLGCWQEGWTSEDPIGTCLFKVSL